MTAQKCPLEGRRIYLVDTTLRDGEQTAGVVFTNQEKRTIAQMLSDIGVDQIEVGIPIMGGDEKEAVKSIVKLGLKPSIMTWNRAVITDIEASLDCGVDAVAISISVSDMHIQDKLKSSRERVLEQMVRAVEFAKKNGLYVSANAEDASRADEDFLALFARCAHQAGADRLRYSDTVGVLNPFSTHDRIKRILDQVNIEIEIHSHNDFGLATANTLAGILAGANYASTTVNGLGERAGNAALEEVAMALKHTMGYKPDLDTGRFLELSRYVARASARELPISKPIVGANIFAHEAGVHADGAIKNPHTYEAFQPEEIGLKRQIMIGKHSGSAAVLNKFRDLNLEINNAQARMLLVKIREKAVELKRPLSDTELIQLYNEHVQAPAN